MVREMAERRRRLLRLLEERGEVRLEKLLELVGASAATVRRDLARLEREGMVVRTFGGARPVPAGSLVVRTFEEKRERMRAEKERLGRAAAGMVKPGMVVALDSGTTIWRVAAALKERGALTVLTSALAPLEELGAVEGITIHLVGGRFRLANLDFAGAATVEGYRDLHADIAFIGADSYLPGKGAFSLDEGSAAVAAAIGRCAERRVVVVDHTKFDAKGCCLVAESGKIDCLITDAGMDEETRGRLSNEPFRLTVVE